MGAIDDLQEWYLSHCDGDWEQTNGVDIVTLDDPGWSLQVDLAGTELEDAAFAGYSRQVDGGDWISCKVRDRKFVGSGGPKMLEEIIGVFLEWARTHAPQAGRK